MLKIKNLLFCLVFFTFCVQAQESKEVLDRFKKRYDSLSDYQVSLLYKLYKGHQSKTAYQTTKGVFLKKGDQFYSKINELEVVNNRKNNLKINHLEKAILISNTQKHSKQLGDFRIEELSNYLDITVFNTLKNSFEITLESKEVTQLPFKAITLIIDKETYNLKKQVFYYFRTVSVSSTESKEEASLKLEINYLNYKTKNFTISEAVFNNRRYINKQDKDYTGIGAYQGFEIINLQKGTY